IDSIVENKLNEFIENTGALEIVCGEFADITKILEDYFSATPPFGKEVKKKNEFPDAITLNAMIYAELSGDFPLGDSRQP
ncbi:PIN domain-containing protein, partial [Acinetobacter baumannii]